MPDLDDHDDSRDVVDGIDDSVISLSHPITIAMTGQFLATWRAGIDAQGLDTGNDTPSIVVLSDLFEFPCSGAFDLDAISCHAASTP